MKERVKRLRAALDAFGLGCLLVTEPANVRYLSGFTGSSAAALITPVESILVTDGRYREQALREADGWDVRVRAGSMFKEVAGALPGREPCGFEVTCSFHFYRKLEEALPEGSSLQPVEGLVEDLRVIKDDYEVELVCAALECATRGFEEAHPLIKVGASERAIAAELDYHMVLAGADGPAFDTLVASGPNSSLPHAPLTDRKFTEGDLVVIDFGARRLGYRSDTTRTISMPGVNPGGEKVLQVVRGALCRALEVMEPGVRASEVDSSARKYIAQEGFAEHFNHSLGHGVGIETHEKPTLSSISADVIEPGMVFTVEPGIYIEGWGGARIEELVLMTIDGPELLSSRIE